MEWWFYDRESPRDKVSSSLHHFKGRYYQWLITFDRNPDHLSEIVLIRLPYHEVNFFWFLILCFHLSLLCCASSEQPTLKGVKSYASLLEGKISTQIIWNPSVWHVYLFSTICWFIQSLVYININSWTFILHWIIIKFYFIFCSLLSIFGHGKLFQLTRCPSDILHHCGFLLLPAPYFQTLQKTAGSSCVLFP